MHNYSVCNIKVDILRKQVQFTRYHFINIPYQSMVSILHVWKFCSLNQQIANNQELSGSQIYAARERPPPPPHPRSQRERSGSALGARFQNTSFWEHFSGVRSLGKKNAPCQFWESRSLNAPSALPECSMNAPLALP
jgi:hypothetical protein